MIHKQLLFISVCYLLHLNIQLIESRGALIFEETFDTNFDKWDVSNEGGGFGNNEAQFYRPQNARIENGNLVIDSKIEWYENHRYTSARLISRRTFKYGYFEMRAKLPWGRGTWPAFWLLGAKNFGTNLWPRYGEIDIMEHVGFEPGIVHGTIHCLKYYHKIGTQKGSQTFVNDVFNQYHTYALEWTPNRITVFADGVKYFEYNKEPGADYTSWPFDDDFKLILNNAIGGDWGGAKKIDDSIFPTRYTIDYIRVYELDGGTIPPPGRGCRT